MLVRVYNHLQSIHGEEEGVPEVPHHILPTERPVGHDGEVIVLYCTVLYCTVLYCGCAVPVGHDGEVLVLLHVVALHVHVEVPAHQDRDAQVVGAEGAHKLQELAHVPRPGQSSVLRSPPISTPYLSRSVVS